MFHQSLASDSLSAFLDLGQYFHCHAFGGQWILLFLSLVCFEYLKMFNVISAVQDN